MTLGWAVTALASGLLVWLLPAHGPLLQPALAAHLALGAVLTLALAIYLPRHLAATEEHRRRTPRRSGWGLAALFLLLLAGGVGSAVPRDLVGLRLHEASHYLHGGAALAAVLLLWLHRLTAPRDRLPPAEVALLLGSLGGVAAALALAGRSPPPPSSSPVRPEAALRVAASPLPVEVLADTDSCAPCHADIVAQWSGSAHRFASFKNPFYLHALQTLDGQRGREVTRFCAGCHDPLPLLAGVFERGEPLSERLPLADRGVTCLVCHTAFHEADPRGNGGIETARRRPLWPGGASPAPTDPLSRWLVRVEPRAHAARVSSPLLKTAAFCGACHKVGLPASLTGWRFVRGFNDSDPWQQSAFSHQAALPFGVADEKSCAACHMPRVASRDLAARDGKVLDHRFAAANTALAARVGDAAWLKRAEEGLREARAEALPLGLAVGDQLAVPLDGGAVPGGGEVTLHVAVIAPGVGHLFPGGTLDSHEAWVELEVKNARGELVARHGAPEADGGPGPEAHRLRARPLDGAGAPIVERDAFRTRTVLYNHAAVPGAGELVRYRFTPRPDDGKLTVTTRLWFRKFSREFHGAVFRRRGEPEPSQPRLLLAERTARLDVGAALAAGPCNEATARLLTRYAPSATLQGDSATATRVAQAAARCGLPGPGALLEARAALRANQPARSSELSAGLLARGGVPEAAARMVHALSAIALGDDPTALADLDRLAAIAPRDREVWKARARLHARSGDPQRALADAAEALRIDPEDASACWVQMIAAGEAGRADVEREARRCYEAYREDESQRQLARLRRGADHADDLEADPIHVHDAAAR